MSDSPTVAHVMRTFLSPTETFIGNQLTTLQGYRPVVFCHHRLPNTTYPLANVHCVQELLALLPRLLDHATYRLARYLPEMSAEAICGRIDAQHARLLHFHYLVDARFFLELKPLTRLPAIVSVYGYDVSSFPRALGGLGQRYLQAIFREMDCFLAMSRDMGRDLVNIGCPEDKIIVHYYGTDTDRFAFPERSYPEKETLEILMCGTLEVKKAQDRVLQALRLWEQRTGTRQRFRVTYVGNGPLRVRLERLVEEYGWKDRVRFLGHIPYHRSQLVEEYRRADIFALPCVTIKGDKEGIPGTIVEAMASGLPVVSTYHAGIPEVICHEKNGLLVEEGDIGGLAQALGRLIEDRALRERLGQTAAQRVASCCRLQSRTRVLERVYDALLAGKSPSQIAGDQTDRIA